METILGVGGPGNWRSWYRHLIISSHQIIISSNHHWSCECGCMSGSLETGWNTKFINITCTCRWDYWCLLYVYDYIATLSFLLMPEMCGARCRDKWPWTVLVWESQVSPTKWKKSRWKLITIGQLGHIRPPYKSMESRLKLFTVWNFKFKYGNRRL